MRSAVSGRGERGGHRAERDPVAHHLLDLRLLLHPPALQRLLLQRPLGGEDHLFAALGPLAEDARQEQHRRVGAGVQRVVEPVPGLRQVIEREGRGSALPWCARPAPGSRARERKLISEETASTT